MATRLGTQKAIGAGIFLVGCLLLAYMVAVESEPGALPLVLVAVGAGWYLGAWWRSRH